MRKLFYLLCIGISLMFSCQKDASIREDLPPIINKDTLTLSGRDTLTLYVGDVTRFDYKIKPATYDSTQLVWSSTDTSVIGINKSLLTAKKEGRSTITVKDNANTASVSCVVTVVDRLKLGLIAYYPFNNSVADSSGNGNHGTGFNLTSTSNRFGKINAACYFNGYSSYVSVPDKQPLRLYNTNFTLSTWVKMEVNNPSFGSMILNKHYTGVDNGWTWSITGQASYPLSVGFFGPGGGSNNAYGTKAVGLNEWHMVTSVYTAATQRLAMYVDGALDNVTNNVLTPNSLISATLYIGCDNPTIFSNGYFFQGAMDEIRVYGRALNLGEIQQLYNSKK